MLLSFYRSLSLSYPFIFYEYHGCSLIFLSFSFFKPCSKRRLTMLGLTISVLKFECEQWGMHSKRPPVNKQKPFCWYCHLEFIVAKNVTVKSRAELGPWVNGTVLAPFPHGPRPALLITVTFKKESEFLVKNVHN